MVVSRKDPQRIARKDLCYGYTLLNLVWFSLVRIHLVRRKFKENCVQTGTMTTKSFFTMKKYVEYGKALRKQCLLPSVCLYGESVLD